MDWDVADADQPDYYWQNFEVVRRWVLHYHSALLSRELHEALDHYQQLSANAQKLWLRLYMRKGELFRTNKLHYHEIDIDGALDELAENGWICLHKNPSANALKLFTKAELTAAFPGETLARLSKAEIVQQLEHTAAVLPEAVIELQKNSLFQQLSLLFFGNRHQQLSEFVVTALGHVRYEPYHYQPRAVFPDRRHFEIFCKIEQWQQHYKELPTLSERIDWALTLPLNDCLSELPERYHGRFSRFLNRVARDCERQQQFEQALTLYQRSSRPPSRERQARILYRLNKKTRCQQVLTTMRQHPWDEPELAVATQLLARWFKQPTNTDNITITEELVRLKFTARQVEQAALSHYQQLGWQGLHAENLIVQSLFGLIFWDIIFSEVDGAFIHPFQRAPRDLTSPAFFKHRQQLISDRLKLLLSDTAAVQQLIRDTIEQKQGIANPFVPWRWHYLSDVEAWFNRLPAKVWHDIFQRLAFDVKNNRSGFPDLWLYNDKGQVKLVEVKGPGDSIRSNQSGWLNFLAHRQVDVRLMKVQPTVDAVPE